MIRSLRIYLLFYYYHYVLNKHGIKHVCEKLKQKNKTNSYNTEKTIELKQIIDLCNNIEKIREKHFLGDKVQCLHRSVIGYSILTKQGVNIDLCIGISKGNFDAHAWLEYQGLIVNDDESMVRKKYNVIIKT